MSSKLLTKLREYKSRMNFIPCNFHLQKIKTKKKYKQNKTTADNHIFIFFRHKIYQNKEHEKINNLANVSCFVLFEHLFLLDLKSFKNKKNFLFYLSQLNTFALELKIRKIKLK